MRIVYERRPDLFARFAEKERHDLAIDDQDANDFFYIVTNEVIEPQNIPNRTATAVSLIGEARRRSRIMYGMELRPKIKITPAFSDGKSIKRQQSE